MLLHQIVDELKNSFNFYNKKTPRSIGIECEIPIVTEKGEAVPLYVIQNMFKHLGTIGFEIEWDDYSDLMITAKKKNEISSAEHKYYTDTITTDTGYSIVELVLAPQKNLHTTKSQLWELLSVLTHFFKSENCLMLGYGIQPVTSPSRKLLMPKERYFFFEKLSTNHFIPKSVGADSSFLNITASNQCHISLGSKEIIPAVNMLNALSGLQIALHANSPIWKGKIDHTYKANREMIWDFCFPERLNQVGIPPKFETAEEYIEHLLNFKPLLIKRDEQLFQILNKSTFKDYLLNKTPTIGSSLNGKQMFIEPHPNDIEQLIPFSWFNARLVPKYGTIESRMCCQQPPQETLTSAALTLGLIENLEAANDLVKMYSLNKWQIIRKEAAKHALNTYVDGDRITPLLLKFLDIANEGLKKRNLQEEIYLEPLYLRIKQQKTPADIAIEIFENQGMTSFINHIAFKNEMFKQQTSVLKLQDQVLTNSFC